MMLMHKQPNAFAPWQVRKVLRAAGSDSMIRTALFNKLIEYGQAVNATSTAPILGSAWAKTNEYSKRLGVEAGRLILNLEEPSQEKLAAVITANEQKYLKLHNLLEKIGLTNIPKVSKILGNRYSKADAIKCKILQEAIPGAKRELEFEARKA